MLDMMEAAYVLLINQDDTAVAMEALGIISHRLEMVSSSVDKSLVLGHIVCTDEDGHHYQPTASSKVTWCSLPDLVATLEAQTSDTATLPEEQNCSSVAEILHQLADILPYCGIPLHVMWIRPQLSTESESFLPTIGAVLRLVHWHNAQVTIVHPGETTGDVQSLVDICRAKVVPDVQSVSISPKIWMGKISVTSKIEGHGIVFPGFCMSCEDKSLLFSRITGRNLTTEDNIMCHSFGRMVEVLDEINIRTIPMFMLSALCVSVHLENDHPHSKQFVQYVNSLDKLGLLARIAVYQPDSIPKCADKMLSTSCWKGGIMADISNIQEVDEEILPQAKYVHLLLMKHAETDVRCLKAVVITNPEDINAEMFRFSRTRRVLSDHCKVKGNMNFDLSKFIKTLPQLSDVMLQEMHHSLIKLQVDELKEWLEKLKANGESTVLSKHQLFEFLNDIQEEFLSAVLKDCPLVESTVTLETDLQLPSPVLDFDVDPAEWPERLALQYRENQKRTLRRFQSSDSVALSSPIHPDEASTLVDASDFLRCFHPDGNAAIDKLSPVRQQSSCRFKKVSNKSDASLKWPDCKDCQYHGIYYNRDRKDEQQSKHYAKVRDKLQRQETHGFCSSVHKPGSSVITSRAKRIGHRFSPSRKSSRKLKTAWNTEDLSVRLDNTNMTQSPQTISATCTLRRSPRKKPTSAFDSSKFTPVLPRPNKRKRSPEGAIEETDSSVSERVRQKISDEDKQKLDKQSRSQRHKKKLEQIVTDVLVKHGVTKDDSIYKSCETKLFQVTKFFVKALPNSRNLGEEMRHIAEGQVTQVVDLEKRRIAMKTAKKHKVNS
ncbi:mdm2-binding protein-like isoform X1 [Gigantopelta aegis]|uniref:mdm2-binding protein-like isoform X1 n=1 Tax=Gigantopelta aegis TaxID=1735272 RepID=UPI001B889C0E|nr:mdm2-binding protein-like isoform X1 [Gigantopelta aegis]